MINTNEKDARIVAWKAIFDDLLKDAPLAPIFNEKQFTVPLSED
jgi:hypothetical protein